MKSTHRLCFLSIFWVISGKIPVSFHFIIHYSVRIAEINPTCTLWFGDLGTRCCWCEAKHTEGKKKWGKFRVRAAGGGSKHICPLLTFEGLLRVNGGCAIETSILECQKAVSTPFWTRIEQLLCLKATLCTHTIETLCVFACEWKPGLASACIFSHSLPPSSSSSFPLRFAPLSPRYFLNRCLRLLAWTLPERDSERRRASIWQHPLKPARAWLASSEQSSPTAKNWWKLIVSALGKDQK